MKRITFLLVGIATMFAIHGYAQTATPDTSRHAIRPFHVTVPQAGFDDLRQRVLATRWPDKETVSDESQGIPLAAVQALLQYWSNGYNWRNIDRNFSPRRSELRSDQCAKRQEKKTVIESKRNGI